MFTFLRETVEPIFFFVITAHMTEYTCQRCVASAALTSEVWVSGRVQTKPRKNVYNNVNIIVARVSQATSFVRKQLATDCTVLLHTLPCKNSQLLVIQCSQAQCYETHCINEALHFLYYYLQYLRQVQVYIGLPHFQPFISQFILSNMCAFYQ